MDAEVRLCSKVPGELVLHKPLVEPLPKPPEVFSQDTFGPIGIVVEVVLKKALSYLNDQQRVRVIII
ncbi:hypothetical protein [Myxococcus xanthus]|uniref:Uncharacterized protein n=1 Tax=Myxococcus xanthus TaxID=34 RepID=A0A7Y4IIK6_MYXXA|nr:hypothetical protein [Myxococcus xanthus]NOJ79824.1 hypothetical protein [Myxococcus xanthus]NOJ86829.1 hypothetical protein [Myxococcus xanthus]